MPHRVPAHAFFAVSAIFHYLGPSFAVLLFAHVEVLGVAWLRIATAALVFAVWRRPWTSVRGWSARSRRLVLALGIVLAAMNSAFYLAINRLPLATVGSIEFLGVVLLAAIGARTPRNVVALVLTICGVAAISGIRIEVQPLGLVFAFGNCALFVLYVILGHRIANAPEAASAGKSPTGIDRLALSMLVAVVAMTPVGLGQALAAFSSPWLLLAGAAVGISSSVIPYVTDQLAMARLPRATFALMLSLLPMFAVLVGACVLRQIPTAVDVIGISLVTLGVALHKITKCEEAKT